MEIENSTLQDFTFADNSTEEVRVPKPVAYRENIQSQMTPSFEAVLHQNEDLMNRLKVSLRRLSILENDNAKLTGELNQVKLHNQSLGSHYAVYKEDVQSLKQEISQKNADVSTLLEIKTALERRIVKFEAQIAQFEKFQEKIQLEVKPYITELKTENIKLKEEIASLKPELEKSEALVSQLRTQIIDMSFSFKQQSQFLTQSLDAANIAFEDERKLTSAQIADQDDQIQSMASQIIRLNKKVEHCDQLENELIAVKHQLDTFKEDFVETNSQLNRDISAYRMQIDNLKHDNNMLAMHKSETETKLENILDQMANLRQIYSQRTADFESLQKTNSALERLNLDLSQRLLVQGSNLQS